MGAGSLGFHHALGNLLAHGRHGNHFTGNNLNLRYRNRLRLRLLRRLGLLLLLRWARLLRRGAYHLWSASALAMLLNKALNIALADSPAQTGAGNLAEINVILTRHAAHQRRRAQALAILPTITRCGSSNRLGAGGRLWLLLC